MAWSLILHCRARSYGLQVRFLTVVTPVRDDSAVNPLVQPDLMFFLSSSLQIKSLLFFLQNKEHRRLQNHLFEHHAAYFVST